MNDFENGSTERYTEIVRQIHKAKDLGITTIRINDSLGRLLPATTRRLCQALVRDFPELTFCLHSHNDRGLAVANTLESIDAGFTMAEGALCGYGNRSGITPLEQLNLICQEQGIQLGAVPLDQTKLVQAAQFAEAAFLFIPNTYRPVSGIWEKQNNYGVLNIPDFLQAQGYSDSYFINYAGLHSYTIEAALKLFYEESRIDCDVVQQTLCDIREKLETSIAEIEEKYHGLRKSWGDFYESSCVSPAEIALTARKYLPE